MTAVGRSPSQRGTANRRKGHQAERDLCRWLRVNGFSGAERAVRTGYRGADRTTLDPGDLTGMGPIIVSVKDCAAESINQWFRELDAMAFPDGTRGPRLLVAKRRGHAVPGRWWCWMRVFDLVELADDAETAFAFPVRLELEDAVMLLRSAGYGDELPEGSARFSAPDHPGTRANRAERGSDELRRQSAAPERDASTLTERADQP